MKINIKDRLATKGISRYELAKRIGVTYPTITSIYNGDSTSIKFEILESICKELNCTPDDIIIPEDEATIFYQKTCRGLHLRLLEYYNLLQERQGSKDNVPTTLLNEIDSLNKEIKTYSEAISQLQKDETK